MAITDPDEPLTPLERVRVNFLIGGHDDVAEAFATVDLVLRTFITHEPETPQAHDLQFKLFDLLDSWSSLH